MRTLKILQPSVVKDYTSQQVAWSLTHVVTHIMVTHTHVVTHIMVTHTKILHTPGYTPQAAKKKKQKKNKKNTRMFLKIWRECMKYKCTLTLTLTREREREEGVSSKIAA